MSIRAFKAIKDPAGASWPSGKPVWGGSSGASGTGETKNVGFTTLSTSKTDYKTVTAECGNTVTVNVVCYRPTGTLTPDDNFDQRSQTKYGVAETVVLAVNIDPGGVTASEAGGLKWKKVLGVGTLTNVTNSGTANYDAGATAGTLYLVLEIQSGPSKQFGPGYDRTIIAPSGAYLKRKPGTGLRHTISTWSCGWKGEAYLLPKDVSFTNIQEREGSCNATATGWLVGWNNFPHPVGSWFDVGDGNITNGCKVVNSTDTVYSGALAPPPAYAVGDFNWPIPWQYRVGTGDAVTFATLNHHATSDAAGKCVMEKGTVSESRVPADATSTY